MADQTWFSHLLFLVDSENGDLVTAVDLDVSSSNKALVWHIVRATIAAIAERCKRDVCIIGASKNQCDYVYCGSMLYDDGRHTFVMRRKVVEQLNVEQDNEGCECSIKS